MLEEFEKGLIDTLKEVCENTRVYLGEFENKEEMELLLKGQDISVFVEFMDGKYENSVQSSVRFNIHILTATSSKTPSYRQENKFKAYKLLEIIDKKLQESLLNNEFAIELKSLKVQLNKITDYGYMFILTREIGSEFLNKDDFLTKE